MLKRTLLQRGAVSSTVGEVGETFLSLVVTKNPGGEIFVYAGGKVTRWPANGSQSPTSEWTAGGGGIAFHEGYLYWGEWRAGTKRLVRSDRSGVITDRLEDLPLYQFLYPRIEGTRAGLCFTQDGGRPTFRPWAGGALTLGGERFSLSHSSIGHCVWTTGFSAGVTSVAVFDVNDPTAVTILDVTFDVRDAVVVGNRVILLERGSGRLLVGGLNGGTLVAPTEPRNTSTLRFTSLVASDTAAFALAGLDVFEVVP